MKDVRNHTWPGRCSPDITIKLYTEINGSFNHTDFFFSRCDGEKRKKFIHFFLHPFPKDWLIFFKVSYLLLFICNLHCLSFFLIFHSAIRKVSWTAERLLKDHPGERTAVSSPQEDETISLQVASASIELNGKLFTHHQKGKHKKDLRHCLHFASSLYWATAYWTPTKCTLQVFLVLWCRQHVQCN